MSKSGSTCSLIRDFMFYWALYQFVYYGLIFYSLLIRLKKVQFHLKRKKGAQMCHRQLELFAKSYLLRRRGLICLSRQPSPKLQASR